MVDSTAVTVPRWNDPVQEFLCGQAYWRFPLGPEGHWEGTRRLDRGPKSLVGLFTYIGPPELAPAITEVVVKQSYKSEVKAGINPLEEGRILSALSRKKNRHFVRMFGEPHEDVESRGREVVRLFLEYCPRGSAGSLVRKYSDDPRVKPLKAPEKGFKEIDLWAMFAYLIEAVRAMEEGISDLPVEERPGELIHHDINLDNILLGDPNPRVPVFKLGNFKYAKEESIWGRAYATSFSWTNQHYEAPEWDDRGQPLEVPFQGSCTNIWQVGCVMHSLIFRDEQPDLSSVDLSVKEKLHMMVTGGWYKFSHGHLLGNSPIKNLYSYELRDLVMHCMNREARKRLGTWTLGNLVNEGRRNATERYEKRESQNMEYQCNRGPENRPRDWVLAGAPSDFEWIETPAQWDRAG